VEIRNFCHSGIQDLSCMSAAQNKKLAVEGLNSSRKKT
jgi:hypothetical protein